MAAIDSGTTAQPAIVALEATAHHCTVVADDGLCTLHYWVYGTGPSRLLLIEGLEGAHYGWEEQIVFFCNLRDSGGAPVFSVIGMDNRGIGRSTATAGPYTTTMLAKDAVCVLTDCGWWSSGSIHVAGFSMGGMIAQELFAIDPMKFLSVSLVATSAGGGYFWSSLPTLSGILAVVKMSAASSPEEKRRHLISMIFSERFIAENKELVWRKITNREKLNGPINPMGSKGQTDAVLHHNALEKLVNAAHKNPATRILILCGSADIVVPPGCSQKMHQALGKGSRLVIIPGAGHHINDECIEAVNKVLLETITG
ncbi:alpha/beta hydrolase family protein [Pelomyxa schiedti]|nr:alpha/beta hydrolase family protein [Pelomyxa schiedti]